MNRRDFLHRSAMIAAGAVAADQLELLDRLGWVRRFFPGWTAPGQYLTDGAGNGMFVTAEQWDALLRDTYGHSPMVEMVHLNTPFLKRRREPASLYQPIVSGSYIEVVSR